MLTLHFNCNCNDAQLAGSSSRVVHKPLPQDDPKQRRPDITVAMANLDWRPRTQLEEGLVATIEYFK
jgi:UDP-glucuronate decarboxylase